MISEIAYPFKYLNSFCLPGSGVEGSNNNVSTALDVTFLIQLCLLGILAEI